MRSLRQKRRNKAPEISMLNLIDVIFTMLIFFMVATTFNNYSQLGLTLPGTNIDQKDNKEQRVEVLLNKNKEYYLKIDGRMQKIELSRLETELNALNIDKEKNVTLTADKDLEYGLIIDLMGKLKNSGIKNVSLNIQTNLSN